MNDIVTELLDHEDRVPQQYVIPAGAEEPAPVQPPTADSRKEES